MPVYDVQLVGYPQRMRDHDARQRILRGRGEGAAGATHRGLAQTADDVASAAGRQPFAAMSVSTAASVRTGTPVPPFVV